MERIIVMSEVRKLNFNEILLISKILREMGTKNYAEYVMRLNERLNDKMKKDKDPAKTDKDKLTEKNNALGIDVAIFVLENLETAKDSLFELFSSYNEISIDEAKKMDSDKVAETIKNMFDAGLPEILKKLLAKTGINFLAGPNV